MATQAHSLSYAGCNFLRQRLVLSTLSGRPVKIRRIRARDDNPGLRDFEASFIRLLDKVTNGSRIEINQTGTTLYYQPGLLYGGSVEHDCNVLRSIGYYLESLLCLAPFMKHPLRIVLRGVTNDQVDPSVDVLKATALPLLKQFGIDGESFELKVVRRGMPPGGGGEVFFSCPVRKVLKPIQLTDPGKIKRIRGTAYSVRVSPQMANRIVDSARSILNKFIPDIYIYTDHMKGINSGKSPGFGLSLVAETTNGTFLSAELASNPQGQGAAVLPEDLGRNCAKLLLEEIYRVKSDSREWMSVPENSLSPYPTCTQKKDGWMCGLNQPKPGFVAHDPWTAGCFQSPAGTSLSLHDRVFATFEELFPDYV
ncbi:RNA 3'-terminal phosphate cyclase-like protein isoform 2-T2 [Lycaon pictus]